MSKNGLKEELKEGKAMKHVIITVEPSGNGIEKIITVKLENGHDVSLKEERYTERELEEFCREGSNWIFQCKGIRFYDI